ncbi:helix-turn-helix domain-containing protein [Trueperella pyogenes]|uniref:helix-turn-helix domain-containing protein n=1 Tax=Trueperella pyogenes TaxID=1661 RepID=UPI00324A32D3
MSWQASAWALDQVKGIGASTKLVLLSLCEFANDEQVTWRSMASIAARSECATRTVRRHLQSLEDYGLISRKPMYRWCDSDSEACVARGGHKHRSGTLYRVNMEVGKFDLSELQPDPEDPHSDPDEGLADEEFRDEPPFDVGSDSVDNPVVDNLSAENEVVDKSTGANLALVEETLVSSGNPHSGQIGHCENGQGSTVANSGIPQAPKVATIRSYNPHINLQPSKLRNLTQDAPARFSDGSDRSVDCGLGGGAAPATDGAADSTAKPDSPPGVGELVGQCLPASWLELLDDPARRQLSGLLAAALGRGWPKVQIRRLLDGQPGLGGAQNPVGVIIHRVRRLVEDSPPVVVSARERKARELAQAVALLEAIIAGEGRDVDADWLVLNGLGNRGWACHKVTGELWEQAWGLVKARRRQVRTLQKVP